MTYNFKKIAIIIGAAIPFIATNVNAKPLNGAFKLGGFPTKQATFDNKKKEKEQTTKTTVDKEATIAVDGTKTEVIKTHTCIDYATDYVKYFSLKTVEETIITKPNGEKSISIKTYESSQEDKLIIKGIGNTENIITKIKKETYPDGKIIESTRITTTISKYPDPPKTNKKEIEKTTYPDGKTSTKMSSHESSIKVEKIIE